MARLKTIRAFGEWVKSEANIAGLLKLMVEDGHTLQKACLVVKQPYSLVHPFLHSTPELLARYEGARKARADKLWDEKMEIADGVKGAEHAAHVAAAKLRSEVRGQEAVAWNPDRYGQKLKVEKSVSVGVDQGLLETATDLLRRLDEKVVSSVPAAMPEMALTERKAP